MAHLLTKKWTTLLLPTLLVLNCRQTEMLDATSTLKNSQGAATLIHKAGLNDVIIAIAVSPVDPYRVVVANQARMIKALDLRAGRVIWERPSGLLNELLKMAYSADGKVLGYSAARDMRTRLGFLNAADGSLIAKKVGNVEEVDDHGVTLMFGWSLAQNPVVEFSPSQRAYIVQSDYQNKAHEVIIKFVDLERDKELHVWKYDGDQEFLGNGDSYFSAFKFSADGARVLGLHRFGYMVWDTISGKRMARNSLESMMPDPNAKATDAAISPDGRVAAVAVTNAWSGASRVWIFDAEKSKLICEFPTKNQASVTFSKSAASVMIIDGVGHLYRVRTTDCSRISEADLGIWQMPQLTLPINYIAISDDRRYLVSPFNPETGKQDDVYMYEMSDAP